MTDYNDRPTSVTVTRSSGGGLYSIVGALVVVVLIGTFVMVDAPVPDTQVANGPCLAQGRRRPRRHRVQPATAADPAASYCRSTSVRSTNQLCGETKPFTFLLKARGLRSCTMKSHGGLSTRRSWAAA